MKRGIAIGAAAIGVLGAVGALLTPTIAQRYAQSQVDGALERMRVQTTSVVNRGDVTVDLAGRSITVHELTTESARREQRVRIGKLTIVRPSTSDRKLFADKVVFDDVTVQQAGETISAPRIEIDGYSGPERGLTATPGIGRNARTQADLIALVSLDRAVAPVVTFSGDETHIRRVLRNLAVNRVTAGVVESATVDGVALDVPYIPPDQSPETSSMAVTAGPLVYEGVNLPTLWRFYAGDGVGERTPFLKRGVIANVISTTTLRPGGVISFQWKRLTLEDVKIRPLGYPVTALDPLAAKIWVDDASTPAELREQLLFGADGMRAVSFHRVAIEGVKGEVARTGDDKRTFELNSAEIGPYADGRLDAIKADGLSYRDGKLFRVVLKRADARGLDASGLLDYADRLGRDKALLTLNPTATDVVRYAPRLTTAEVSGVDLAGSLGTFKAASVKADVNAPLDAVPQHVAFGLDDLDAAPAAGSGPAELLDTMRLPTLKGGLNFALTLDPSAQTLALDRLDYNFEGLGSLEGKGELSAFGPALLLASGSDFIDKFSQIGIGQFKFDFVDDGAVATVLTRAAERARVPVDLYRTQAASDAQATILRLFGPPAENSAESAAEFIRDPRRLEITINPRGASATMIELIQAGKLGLNGLAQVLDVAMLYKR